jgi:hypothetical protein
MCVSLFRNALLSIRTPITNKITLYLFDTSHLISQQHKHKYTSTQLQPQKTRQTTRVKPRHSKQPQQSDTRREREIDRQREIQRQNDTLIPVMV